MELEDWLEEWQFPQKVINECNTKGLHVTGTCGGCISFQGEPNYAERKEGTKLRCKQNIENDGDVDFGCIYWEKKYD